MPRPISDAFVTTAPQYSDKDFDRLNSPIFMPPNNFDQRVANLEKRLVNFKAFRGDHPDDEYDRMSLQGAKKSLSRAIELSLDGKALEAWTELWNAHRVASFYEGFLEGKRRNSLKYQASLHQGNLAKGASQRRAEKYVELKKEVVKAFRVETKGVKVRDQAIEEQTLLRIAESIFKQKNTRLTYNQFKELLKCRGIVSRFPKKIRRTSNS